LAIMSLIYVIKLVLSLQCKMNIRHVIINGDICNKEGILDSKPKVTKCRWTVT
jgi:hypothetical protein